MASCLVLAQSRADTATLRPCLRSRLSGVDILGNPRVPLATSRSARGLPVNVLGATHDFEMLWADAPLVLAEMVDMSTVRNGAYPEFIGKAMSEGWAAYSLHELPVSVVPDAASPNQTFSLLNEALHESIFDGSGFPWHRPRVI